jgi:excisionase family DNA binding protein
MSDEKRVEDLPALESTRRVESAPPARESKPTLERVVVRGEVRSEPRAEARSDARGEARPESSMTASSSAARSARGAGREAHPDRSTGEPNGGHDDEAPSRESRRRTPPPDILNIDEAAELLGVSIKTFNKVLHNQNMPARKIGREWKFSRQALIDWVGSGRSQDFYREAGDDEEEEPRVELKPPAAQPGERPKSRRTAGWQIEMD